MPISQPRKLEDFIVKWKPDVISCPAIQTTDEKARTRWSMFGEWEIFAAVVAWNRAGWVIVRERPSESHVGGWSIPGGAVEKNETIENGAVREAKEEAGVEVALFGPTALVRTTLTAPTEKSLQYALAIFHSEVTGGNLNPKDRKEIEKAEIATTQRIELLIERGRFPNLNPNIDKPVADFFRRVSLLRTLSVSGANSSSTRS